MRDKTNNIKENNENFEELPKSIGAMLFLLFDHNGQLKNEISIKIIQTSALTFYITKQMQ